MSELKEHLFCECDKCIREYSGPLSNEMRPYCLKDEADKVIAHHKYKRCLAMVKYCHESAMWLEENGVNKSAVFMLRWEKRWLELAEKFKEVK